MKLENSMDNNDQLVETKIASFYCYLKVSKLRGYAKWTVLSQVVKELHPHGISLYELVSSH